MIEAVNSVVSTSPLAKGSVEAQSVARSYAANPERVQEIAKAPYISPYIRVDVNFDRAVLLIRDSDTGDVLRQFPSESQMEAYRRAEAATSARQQIQAQVAQSSSAPVTAPKAVPVPEQKRTVSFEAPVPTSAPAPQQSAPAPTATPIAIDTQA